MIPPALVKPSAMEGTGFLGQAADDVYRLEKDDLYLVGTAEVPLAAYHSDEILDAESLPLRYAGFSPCFRREAGSYGKDTRGSSGCTGSTRWRCLCSRPSRSRTPNTSASLPGSGPGWTCSTCRTASLMSPPATSACRQCASSTARRGFRRRASTARFRPPPTARSSKRDVSTSARV